MINNKPYLNASQLYNLKINLIRHIRHFFKSTIAIVFKLNNRANIFVRYSNVSKNKLECSNIINEETINKN